MKKAILFLVVTSIVLFSCIRGRAKPEMIEHYISSYYDFVESPSPFVYTFAPSDIPFATDILGKHGATYDIFLEQETRRFYVTDVSHLKELASDEIIRKEKFDSLNRKYNIAPYNKKEIRHPGEYTLWSKRIISIDVTSDQDFDEAHPAGTSLNDIMMFDAYNNFYFIQSNYKEKNLEQIKIYKKLDEVTLEDMTLITGFNWHGLFNLHITDVPTKNKIEEITLNIVIKTDDGGVYPVQKPIP